MPPISGVHSARKTFRATAASVVSGPAGCGAARADGNGHRHGGKTAAFPPGNGGERERQQHQRRHDRPGIGEAGRNPGDDVAADLVVPPPVPGAVQRIKADQHSADRHPGTDVALAHAVERSAHAAAGDDHSVAKEESAQHGGDPEREDVGVGGQHPRPGVGNDGCHHHRESGGGDGQAGYDAAQHAALAHKEKVAKSGHEAEPAALTNRPEGDSNDPEHRPCSVGAQREEVDDCETG